MGSSLQHTLHIISWSLYDIYIYNKEHLNLVDQALSHAHAEKVMIAIVEIMLNKH